MTLPVLAPPVAWATVGRSFPGGPLGRTVALRMRTRAGQGRSGAAGFSLARRWRLRPGRGPPGAAADAEVSKFRRSLHLTVYPRGCTPASRGAALRRPLVGREFRPSPLSTVFPELAPRFVVAPQDGTKEWSPRREGWGVGERLRSRLGQRVVLGLRRTGSNCCSPGKELLPLFRCVALIFFISARL